VEKTHVSIGRCLGPGGDVSFKLNTNLLSQEIGSWPIPQVDHNLLWP